MVLCVVCDQPFAEPDDAAIVEIPRLEDPWGWVAFLEDWRGGPARFVHPECFAERHGVAALVGVVHRRDRINRRGFRELIDERDALRRQLRAD